MKKCFFGLCFLMWMLCSVQAQENNVITIGVAGPFTGSGAVYGEMIKAATELALEQINEAGGINGNKVLAEFGDDQGKNDQANSVAKKLASNPNISIVIGHFNSTCSLAGKPIYKQYGVVEFSPGSTNVNVCKGSEWTFRNLYRDDYQGTFLARYCKKILGLKKVACFFDNDDYGIGLKDAFVKEAEAQGLEIVHVESYIREQTTDYASALTKIRILAPDAIFVAGLYNETASICKQAREKGITVPFLGGDGVFSPGYMQIGGLATEGTYITTPFLFEVGGDKAQEFRDEFTLRFEREPDAWAALTYDAVNMALWTISKVGADRKKIRDHFATCLSPENGYEGITGVTYFDENGDCLKPAIVAIVKDGQFQAAPKQMTN
ncbi:MAG: ABC transporter substrate-binding protein [Planctomycetota bacterium]